MIHYHKEGCILRGTNTMEKGDTVCDSWQIIFSLVRAARGENSCSQTASGSWCTADPIPEPCRSGSHLPGGREAPCCGRVWTFCGTDPEGAVPWLRRGKKKITERTYFLASKLRCFAHASSGGNRRDLGGNRKKLTLGVFSISHRNMSSGKLSKAA